MRKIVQISVTGVVNNSSTQCNYVTAALCDDGTVWVIDDYADRGWLKYPDIPQPTPEAGHDDE